MLKFSVVHRLFKKDSSYITKWLYIYIRIKTINIMTYTNSQIERAKSKYTNFLKLHTLANYDISVIGLNVANQRMEFHNNLVNSILDGNKNLEKEWKMFFLKEVLKADKKENDKKEKLNANKEASSDILAPIKETKRIVEFGKWLNTSGNPFRKQHFSKKYTIEAVNAFLNK